MRSRSPTQAGARESGFSLISLVFAMSITLAIGMMLFQMFLQNEQVFQDQNRVTEMQQSARAVVSMIADDLRLAGQGVPVYSAAQDTTIREAVQSFLDGTDADDLRFRAGVRNVSTTSLGNTGTLFTVDNVSGFNAIVGAKPNRFAYMWGPIGNTWTWTRGEVSAINAGTNQLVFTVSQFSGQGTGFTGPPRLILEEGISYRLNSGAVLRGMTTDFTSLTTPTFTEQTIGTNFTNLKFGYFDGTGNAVTPTTLALRSTIRRVDFTIAAQTAGPLADGTVDTYATTLSVYPRNLAAN